MAKDDGIKGRRCQTPLCTAQAVEGDQFCNDHRLIEYPFEGDGPKKSATEHPKSTERQKG